MLASQSLLMLLVFENAKRNIWDYIYSK